MKRYFLILVLLFCMPIQVPAEINADEINVSTTTVKKHDAAETRSILDRLKALKRKIEGLKKK